MTAGDQAQRRLRRVTGRDIRHYVRSPSFRASVPAYLHLGCAQAADDLEQSYPNTPLRSACALGRLHRDGANRNTVRQVITTD